MLSDVSLLRRENINKNSSQKLHSAATANNAIISLGFARLCVQVTATAVFCSQLNFGTGEISQLCCMAGLKSPAKT